MKTADVVALLARENPIREDEAAPSSVVAAAIKERILESELSRQPGAIAPAAPRRRWLLPAVAAGMLALVAFVVLPGAVSEKRLGASPAAAAVLERAAVAATAYSGVQKGRYAYTKAETLYAAVSTDDQPFTLLLPSVRETWVAADGSGRVVEVGKDPIFLGPRDRERWRAAGAWQPPRTEIDRRVPARRTVPEEVLASEPEAMTLEQLDLLLSSGVAQLPTDPDRLERIVRSYSEKKDPPVEAQMFNQISSLVHSPYASAELRAAAFRVLARIKGVELEGERRDAAGRLGTAVTAPAGYGDDGTASLNASERRRLIIHPETGDVLAEETVLVARVPWADGSPGDVTGSIVILHQGWVDSLEERPDEG